MRRPFLLLVVFTACSKFLGLSDVTYAPDAAPGNPGAGSVCGDGRQTGSEQCDDGNLVDGDGCSPTCTIEPFCAGGVCTATCGDGIVFPGEECDDGNLVDGDGCSHDCKFEPSSGFSCMTSNQPPPPTLVIPILYHDMRYYKTPNGSPDFENFNPGVKLFGLVQDTLGTDGKPMWQHDFGFLDEKKTQPNMDPSKQALNGQANYDCWWRDRCGGVPNAFAKNVFLDVAGNPTTLTLTPTPTPTSSNVYQTDNPQFFPIDGLGWNAPGSEFDPQVDDGDDGVRHNFSFTSELHYPFTYDARRPPEIDFTGDDGIWVFINGRLALDLGGICLASGSVTLDAAHAEHLGLVDGGMYSLDLFQAERHTALSSYKLKLSEFVRAVTTCTPICGDGKVVGNEVCDDGPRNGMSGQCNATCSGPG